jgi:hypothetical protein
VKRIETSIQATATPEEVWDVLMDFPSYPSWNPMVVEIAGQPGAGQRLTVAIAMKGGRKMTFKPTVVEYEPGRRFGWLGKVWVRGLFDGLHRFEVQPNGEATTFVHSEEFRGLLPPLMGKVLGDTHHSIVEMNEALVREVARRKSAASRP